MLNSAQGGILKPKYIQFTVLEEERNQKIFIFNKLDWKANLSEHLVIDLIETYLHDPLRQWGNSLRCWGFHQLY